MKLRYRPRWSAIGLAALLVQGCMPGGDGSPLAPQMFDAGGHIVSQTKQINHEFVITNVSRKPIGILEILKTCTCTTADLDKRLIQPGESASLKLKINVIPILKDWEVHCTLKTDSPSQAEVTYRVKFRTYPDILFSSDVVNLGSWDKELSSGSIPPADVTLDLYTSVQVAKCPLQSLKCDVTVLATTLDSPAVSLIENNSIRKYSVKVKINKNANFTDSSAGGPNSTSLNAFHENGSVASTTVIWTESTPISLVPKKVFFGIIQRDKGTIKKIVEVSSENDHKFHITSMHTENSSEVHGTIVKEKFSNKHAVELSFTPTVGMKRFLSGSVILGTDYPGCSTLQIPWSVIIRDTQ